MRLPTLPDAGEAQKPALAMMDPVGLLPRTPVHPFVETVSRNQAAPEPERLTERGLGRDRLCPCVDQTNSAGVIVPVRHQPPPERSGLTFAAPVDDNYRGVLRGRYVPAREVNVTGYGSFEHFFERLP